MATVETTVAPEKKKNWACIIGVIFLIILGLLLIIGAVGCSVGMVKIFENSNSSSLAQETKWNEKKIEGSGDNKIIVIPIEGVISDSGGSALSGGSGVNSDDVGSMLDQAKNDSSVKAVILKVNSPGGSVTASDIIAEKIKDFKSSGKKIIALFGETAASGGYYISAPADKIISNPSTLTGSIGVILETIDYSGALSYLRVSYNTFRSGEFKDIGTPNRPMTDQEKAILQTLVDNDYNRFVKVVADGRKMTISKVKSLADGRVYDGAQAKDLGLVDELGNMSKAVEVGKSIAGISSATIVQYETPFSFSQILSKVSTKLFGPSELSQLLQQSAQSRIKYLWTM